MTTSTPFPSSQDILSKTNFFHLTASFLKLNTSQCIIVAERQHSSDENCAISEAHKEARRESD